ERVTVNIRLSGGPPPRSAKRLSDGGRDKTEHGEPTHGLDQQLRYAAVVPCCQRRRLIRGVEQKGPVSKKEPRLVFQGRGQWGTTHARQPKLASAMLCRSERDVTSRKKEPRRRQRGSAV